MYSTIIYILQKVIIGAVGWEGLQAQYKQQTRLRNQVKEAYVNNFDTKELLTVLLLFLECKFGLQLF